MKKAISALLFVSMVTMTLSAVPVGADANKLSVRVFVKYADSVERTTANVVDIGDPDGDGARDGYELSGLWWDLSKYPSGVPYVINPKDAIKRHGLAESAVIAEVKASLESWDAVVSVELYNGYPTVDYKAGTRLDYKNVITWKRLRPCVVAVATIWYYSATGEIVDADVGLNWAYKWSIDPDGEGTGYILTDAFDIRNIVTHEAGHWSGLNDIYDDTYWAMTMYGYTTYGETIKISLEPGDVAGVQAVYGV
ncbi:MAG: hypothetical protein QMC89_06290 [Candidatus Hodarchaeaceae archaeon]|nr:hypothetical protein [Candidatus Hodarchaeaceae archaeon]